MSYHDNGRRIRYHWTTLSSYIKRQFSSIYFVSWYSSKYVPSLVKIHWRMLILECSQECYGRTDGRTDGSVNISLRNFVGEGIIKSKGTTKNRKFRCVYMSNELISKIIWRTNFLFGCLFCFLYFLWIVGIILKYTLV